MIRLLACLFALLSMPVAAQTAEECPDRPNITESRLALPGDEALNVFDAGDVFVVAPGRCAEPVYAMQFPGRLEAAEAGDAEAMDVVGLFYAVGAGTEKDWTKALSWLQRASEAGSAKAKYRLAIIAHHGLAGPVDAGRALDLYRAASDGGIGWASTNLGEIYASGSLAEQDIAQAVAFFELGRSQGDPTATQNLAALHAQGAIDGKPDFTAARAFALEAAKQDELGGIRIYAYLLANGSGGARDLRTAYLLASIAAERGDGPSLQLRDRVAEAVGADVAAKAAKRLASCNADAQVACVLAK